MADRKLKIAIAASIPDPAASINIYLDDVLVYENLLINNNLHTPYVLEHTFTAETTHVLKFKMNNDYYTETEDLNVFILYVCLSDENLVYAPNTYLVNDTQDNIKMIDDDVLLTSTLWGENGTFILNINVQDPVVYVDTPPVP